MRVFDPERRLRKLDCVSSSYGVDVAQSTGASMLGEEIGRAGTE